MVAILQTRSLFANDRGHKFALYFMAALYLAAKLRICALSLSSVGGRGGCTYFGGSDLGRIVLGVEMARQFLLESWTLRRILG